MYLLFVIIFSIYNWFYGNIFTHILLHLFVISAYGWSILCLLMHWPLKSPELEQAWYLRGRTDSMYFCSRVNFTYLSQAKFNIPFKMWNILYHFKTTHHVTSCNMLNTQLKVNKTSFQFIGLYSKGIFKKKTKKFIKTLLACHKLRRPSHGLQVYDNTGYHNNCGGNVNNDVLVKITKWH